MFSQPALAAALYAYGKADAIPWAKGLDALLQAVSEKPIDEQQRAANVGVQFGDPVLYVYTSGTTGLPKAAKITHARIRMIGHGFRTMCNIVESDRIYTPLPLYHSAGGILGVGMVLEAGCFMVLRRKFSGTVVSQFLCVCLSVAVLTTLVCARSESYGERHSSAWLHSIAVRNENATFGFVSHRQSLSFPKIYR
jgi:acyl-CoA synthetase (AMP-forming)/AMP-acid ligase II